MKRFGGLWSELVSWDNLVFAAEKARRGKRHRPVVQRFEFRREHELLKIQRELIAGEFAPGPFTTHWISHPKPRLISAAPYRDRVVHHAILNVLEPILDRRFHPDSYACRRGKGAHAAARRLQRLMRRCDYCVQFDVRKFFPSIDHDLLKGQFRRLLKERELLSLMDQIVDGSNEQEAVQAWFPGDGLFAPAERRRGLPIGNLTSQWFANWYLTDFDHRVTCGWGVAGFVRYCDDFVLLDADRERLRELTPMVVDELAKLRLAVHRERVQMAPARAGRTFVGCRVTPARRRLRNAAVRAFLRRLRVMRRDFGLGRLTREEVGQRLLAWAGHAAQADSRAFVRRVAAEVRFQEGRFVRFNP